MNTRRAGCCPEKDSTYSKKQATGAIGRAKTMYPHIVNQWSTAFDNLVTIEQGVNAAASTPGLSPLNIVKAAVWVRCLHASLQSYNDNEALWSLFLDRVIRMLSELILRTINFEEYGDILVPEDPSAIKSPDKAKYYLRLGKLADKKEEYLKLVRYFFFLCVYTYTLFTQIYLHF
jgi:hypothetical protein